MNYDLALISAVLEQGDVVEAVQQGMSAKFLGDEAQVYWDIILEHADKFQEIPSVSYFRGMCPSYEHNVPGDSIESLVHHIKTRHLHVEIDDALEQVAELNADDPWEAKKTLLRMADSINLEVQGRQTDLIAGSDKARVLKRIEYIRQNGGLLGAPWPWPFLNNNSPGVCPGNFIYFYGREGCRKTFLLSYLANWFEAQGHRVLFFTREMTLEEIAWRLYPMRVSLPYQELTSGDITTDGLVKLEDAMDDLYHRKNLIVSDVDGGIAGFRAKIEEVKPSVVIHDYVFSLAEDEMEGSRKREHDAIGMVVNSIKRMAMKKKIPIIACGHANREGEKLKGKNSTEVAGSDKILRRADYGFRVISEDATDRLALVVVKGRQAKKGLSFTLDATLCNGFGNFIEAGADWINDVEDKKDAEDKSRKSTNAPKGKKVALSSTAFTSKAKAHKGNPFRNRT